MFDELVETKISGGGKVTVKCYITDEETIREMEFAEARLAVDRIAGLHIARDKMPSLTQRSELMKAWREMLKPDALQKI